MAVGWGKPQTNKAWRGGSPGGRVIVPCFSRGTPLPPVHASRRSRQERNRTASELPWGPWPRAFDLLASSRRTTPGRQALQGHALR
jgi:hypothetical protein